MVDTLALFSDVHGNRLALEAVLDELKTREITRLYCLGAVEGTAPIPTG